MPDVHYVVRNEEGKLLYEATEIDLDVEDPWENPVPVHGWVEPGSRAALHLTSRQEAEAKAAEHSATVQRVTVTTEDVGLRWRDVRDSGVDYLKTVDRQLYHGVAEAFFGYVLMDGRHTMVEITESDKDHKYRVSWFKGQTGNRRPDGLRGQWKDLDAAKAAAVAAVKATWA